jgi:hypothetical protein
LEGLGEALGECAVQEQYRKGTHPSHDPTALVPGPQHHATCNIFGSLKSPAQLKTRPSDSYRDYRYSADTTEPNPANPCHTCDHTCQTRTCGKRLYGMPRYRKRIPKQLTQQELKGQKTSDSHLALLLPIIMALVYRVTIASQRDQENGRRLGE